MPLTYSINDNTAYEADRLATINEVLNQVPDNTSKLISPKDVRDAIYSSWETSVFKQMTGSASIEYIGIDRNDINQKMLIGKRRVLGSDVLTGTLLNYTLNDTDIFFINNKSATSSNTKISFLSGTDSSLYPNAPYFNSYQGTSSLHLEVVNPTGDITFDSSLGKVSINNVLFPTKAETASASNDQILKYSNGRLVWGANIVNSSIIGSTGSTTNIYGSPVLVNGYNLELTESTLIIATFGNVRVGNTFSKAPLVEVIRQMLYPYVGPQCSLSINANSAGWTTSAVAEHGNILTSNIQLRWTVIKNSDPIMYATLSNSTFAVSTPIIASGMTSVSSYASGSVPTTSLTYVLGVTDSGASNYAISSLAIATGSTTSTGASSSVTLDLVYPFFYGVTATNVTNYTQANSILGSLTKLVEAKSDKTVPLSGVGYIYFIYPNSYGTMSTILDENGFNLFSSFVQSTYTASIDSPNAYWTGISYSVYKHGPLTVGSGGSVNWNFKY